MQPVAIQQKIFEVRGQKVMLDFNLAQLYEVPTKVLNQGVKRNLNRFPAEFMFRLTEPEWTDMRSQIVTAYQSKRNTGNTPFAFTEHGVAMLASVLKSDKAVEMSISITMAFIALRKIALHYKELADEIIQIKRTVSGHNEQLNEIYNAIENILDEKVEVIKWQDRQRIGF